MTNMKHISFLSLMLILSAVLFSPSAEARSHSGVRVQHVKHHAVHVRRSVHRYRHVHRHHHRGGGSSVSLAGIIAPELVAKAREIQSACGSTITSARAHRGYRSNHPIGRAVDMQGNPSCIYAHLRGWSGGYSTDYGRVNHVHISYSPGGQEWGIRFAHGGGSYHSHSRYASRHGYGSVRLAAASAIPTAFDRTAIH